LAKEMKWAPAPTTTGAAAWVSLSTAMLGIYTIEFTALLAIESIRTESSG
jgi:hypothetical protein